MGKAKKERSGAGASASTGASLSNVTKIKGVNFYRDAKQVKHINMLKGGKPTRNSDGKIIKAAVFQTRLAPGTQARKSRKDSDFQTLVKEMVGALHHDEIIPTKHLALNLTWLETFVVTLHYHENTMFRCQQSHFAMAHALAEYVDKRLFSKQEL
eukprot:jgi/Hompol1/1054/HPOL_001164-RA